MRFARMVFWIAGVWGVLLITPLYFLFDLIGQKDPPPSPTPDFSMASSELPLPGKSLSWSLRRIRCVITRS